MDKSKVLKQLKLVPDAEKQKGWDAKETPEGAQQKATKALEDAKQYMKDNAFNLEPATAEKLGGVKVGTGLSVTEDGTISAKELNWENVTGKPESFKPETHQHTLSEISDYVAPVVDAELNKESENALQNKVIATELEQMKKDIGDLLYKPIAINSFGNNINTVEMGTTVTDITFNWTVSKTPKKLMFGEETLDASAKSKTLTGQSLKTNKSFTLKATDERDFTATKTTSIQFLNGIYYGVATTDTEINNAFLPRLTKKLQGGKATTFTVNAGAGQHIFYAVPTRYGNCGFNVGGFDGGFTKVSTFDYTNPSGYNENYDVYKSDNANLGSTTVKVS